MTARAWHLVRLDEVPPTPWRNGGGVTRELLAWPDDADWLVRVSVARIERSGTFSRFDDVERCFVVLSGAGVRLAAHGGARELRLGDEPWGFDGADAPDCELLDGPTEDLNLMVRRRLGRATMTVAAARDMLEASPRWRGLFAADALALDIDGQTLDVPAGSLVWSDAPQMQRWSLAEVGAARAWWLAAGT